MLATLNHALATLCGPLCFYYSNGYEPSTKIRKGSYTWGLLRQEKKE